MVVVVVVGVMAAVGLVSDGGWCTVELQPGGGTGCCGARCGQSASRADRGGGEEVSGMCRLSGYMNYNMHAMLAYLKHPVRIQGWVEQECVWRGGGRMQQRTEA